MTLAIITAAAAAAAAGAHALRQHARPEPVLVIDPYTAWMMRNLPSARAWHR